MMKILLDLSSLVSVLISNNFFASPSICIIHYQKSTQSSKHFTQNQLNPDILSMITQCLNQLPHGSNKNEKPMSFSISDRQNNYQN